MTRPRALQVRVEDALHDQVEAAAKAAGVPVSEWLRRIVVRELSPTPASRDGHLIPAWTDNLSRYGDDFIYGRRRQGLTSNQAPQFLLEPLPTVHHDGGREFVVHNTAGSRLGLRSARMDETWQEIQLGIVRVFLRGSAVPWSCTHLYELLNGHFMITLRPAP